MKTIVFTLCSNNYLAQAKTLGDSLLKHNPDTKFVIGLVDKFHPGVDYSFFNPYTILPFTELNCPEFDGMVERYNIVEFNTAVKPFYIEYFFSIYPGCLVYYIDPDIEIFDSFEDLNAVFDKGFDFILTPHLIEPSLEKSKFEKLILNVGIYNLGFLGIKDSAKSRFFLTWWKERLQYDCRIDFCKGLFVDQIWINYLPAFYDNVYTIRDPGYNMGYWNFSERSISLNEGKYKVNERYGLKFFHFSSFNPLNPEILCKHLNYSFEQRPDLVLLYKNYTTKLLDNRYVQLSSIERLLEFKKNHPYADRKTSKIETIILQVKKRGKKLLKSLTSSARKS